jgi:hypothetical protein
MRVDEHKRNCKEIRLQLVYLFMIYLTTLSVSEIRSRKMELLMNYKGYGTKRSWLNLIWTYYLGICLERLGKIRIGHSS